MSGRLLLLLLRWCRTIIIVIITTVRINIWRWHWCLFICHSLWRHKCFCLWM